MLTAQQQKTARQVYQIAVSHGLSPRHAREMIAAAYAESGLNPGTDNKQGSGAAGLFQLLSAGYVNKARKLGGVHNARANTLAILPDYERYWQQHPNARPGEAARDVELSGEGAGFYSHNLGMFNGVGGAAAAVPSAARPAPTGGLTGAPDKMALIQALTQHGGPDVSSLAALLSQPQESAPAAPHGPPHPDHAPRRGAQQMGHAAGGITELFDDRIGGIKNGHQIGAIGHHGDHVHVSMGSLRAQQAVIAHAIKMGLHVGEDDVHDKVDPVHVKGSYHYQHYGKSKLARAADVSGSPQRMDAFYRWVASTYG